MDLTSKISFSSRLQDPPWIFLERLSEMAKLMGEKGQQALQRNPEEPWRQFINLMRDRLPKKTPEYYQYRSVDELKDDLLALRNSLEKVGAHRIVHLEVDPIIRSVQTFGFHLASLDIRQNSRFHDLAVSQLIVASGLDDGKGYPDWDEQKRLEFLNRELTSPRPFIRPDMKAGEEAEAVLSCYRVILENIDTFGNQTIGALIISMTRSLSDLLSVYLLAREVGLIKQTDDGMVCRLPVVPLFETINDLKNAPVILEQFLSHPLTKASLSYQKRLSHQDEAVQQVMIGYSDSNKDGGIFASLWSLYRAQSQMTEVGKKHKTRIRYFHGRGGTIGRGAGPTHRFIDALPHSSLNGDLRMTEQGETIAQKYANKLNAAYNLELLIAGTTESTIKNWKFPKKSHSLEPVMDQLMEQSRQTYEGILKQDGFIDFFRQATPIDAIESSRIGSRPSRRTGKTSITDLRAIPWVFSWNQSRFYLSGWYGVGSALSNLYHQQKDVFEELKRQNFVWSPLQYIISNTATSMATADLNIMNQYADLVQDKAIKTRFMELIEKEYHLTREMLEKIYSGTLSERRANVSKLLELRQQGLKRLHNQQIHLLSKWRNGKESEKQELLPQLLLTVNAIASGLGATG